MARGKGKGKGLASKAQRRSMKKVNPPKAAIMENETPKGKKLPERVSKRK